jgi:hypothetical protein
MHVPAARSTHCYFHTHTVRTRAVLYVYIRQMTSITVVQVYGPCTPQKRIWTKLFSWRAHACLLWLPRGTYAFCGRKQTEGPEKIVRADVVMRSSTVFFFCREHCRMRSN